MRIAQSRDRTLNLRSLGIELATKRRRSHVIQGRMNRNQTESRLYDEHDNQQQNQSQHSTVNTDTQLFPY